MKTGILAASVVVVLLLVLSLIYWRTQPDSPSEAKASAGPARAAEARPAEGLSSAPTVETSTVAAETVAALPIDQDRKSIETKSVPKVSAETPVPPPAFDASTSAALTADVSLPNSEESEFLSKKYATTSAHDRLLAGQTLEAVLAANRAGRVPKDQVLTKDQAQAYRQEIAWLRDNPNP